MKTDICGFCIGDLN